jgi:hypothetical protein
LRGRVEEGPAVEADDYTALMAATELFAVVMAKDGV